MLEILEPSLSPPHDSAHLHVTGEAIFINDKPLLACELIVGLLYSPHAKAKIISIDIADAQKIPGVVSVVLAQDLHHNLWGSIIPEQPLLASDQVNYIGEVICVVGAETPASLKQALAAIRVDYQILSPILSIDEAIRSKSFIGPERAICRGDAHQHLASSPHRLNGQLMLHGAEHFYLENQSAIAYPLEDGHIEVHSSTQHPTETQSLVAEALGLAFSSVVCVSPRLGGGFGGKETQAGPIAAYAAIIAYKSRRPARLVLTKDDDMIMTGKRNPYWINYDVGFDNQGQILALSAYFYGDGGAYADLSTSILERALLHADNAYFIVHASFKGQVCRTNYHPHTAFRGFGGPKGVAMIEHVLDAVAHALKKDGLDIRKLNCYQAERNISPYGQKIFNNLLPDLFELLEQKSDYRARRQALESWNRNPKNHPRGLAATAIKFGIAFTARFLNQAHALVHLLRDGSVQVATGAVEMGQGVQARIKSLVAEQFGIDQSLVRMLHTRTDLCANTSPTAASSGTDLNGMAAVNACLKLKERLKNYQSSSFSQTINRAYLDRVALSEYGFYKVPGLSFDKISGQGDAFLYFTQGVAASEVEINPLTGMVKILRSDLIMDLGRPINDTLDRGQVAGGFIQGCGWVMSERLYYDHGKLLSHAPSTYKIPSIHDIPRIFSIDLIKNSGNNINLRGTKAVGEPPLMLCFSVWNAIKNALSYRITGPLAQLSIPVNPEDVLIHLGSYDDKSRFYATRH